VKLLTAFHRIKKKEKNMLVVHNSSTVFRWGIACVLTGCLLFALSMDAFAAGTVKEYGIMTSVEDDGTIIISEKGYELSPSLVVHDNRGHRISLRELPLLSRVEFEYEYERRGFVITLIKEVAQ
jgi:hypothetical protein